MSLERPQLPRYAGLVFFKIFLPIFFPLLTLPVSQIGFCVQPDPERAGQSHGEPGPLRLPHPRTHARGVPARLAPHRGTGKLTEILCITSTYIYILHCTALQAGLVASFFSSLRTALYGEQRREARQSKARRRRQLGTELEAVEELPGREQTPASLPALSALRPAPNPGLSDFDARYLGALDDFDELEDITPGLLTLTGEPPRDPGEYTVSFTRHSESGRLDCSRSSAQPNPKFPQVIPALLCRPSGSGS